VTPIDRVRYYDGEFLRAFDFSDEQTYHMEMRRRLNRYLHLYGIVRGLELDDTKPGGVEQVSILPGLAIDALGREIYVFAPYTLGDADVTANRLTNGTYDIWLRYNKTATTPPSSGYGVCNLGTQYTRWQESYTVVLLPSPSSPFTNPAFADQDMDDPSQDDVGVLLGTVTVNPTSPTSQFSNVVLQHRHFWGVIAQQIQAPPGYNAAAAFNLAVKQTPRNPPVSLGVGPNIFAEQNLIVGPDFDLAPNPKTTVPTLNSPGTAKIAADMFVQGQIYSSIPDSSNVPQWLGLSAYVQQLVQQSMPDVQVSIAPNQTVPITPNSGNYVNGSTPVTVTSKLPSVSSFISFAYVSQFEFDTQANVNSLGGLQVQLAVTAIVPNAVSGNKCTSNFAWTAGPATGAFSAIANFTLTAVFICFP
jgi:hypothetical protein